MLRCYASENLNTAPPTHERRQRRASRVVLYARVSSKDQEKEGFSIPAQLRLLRDYAASKGFVIAEEFTDVETAKASGRTNFNEMLAYLQKHPATCRTILVEKTDRLYRNLKDYATIDELGVTIHLVKENQIIGRRSRSRPSSSSRHQSFDGAQLQPEPWRGDRQGNDGESTGWHLPELRAQSATGTPTVPTASESSFPTPTPPGDHGVI